MKLFKFAALAAVLLLPGLAGPGLFQARAENSPEAAVRQLLKQIQSIHYKKPVSKEHKQANEKISGQALEYLNVSLVSRKTLGKYWKQRSPKEQQEFIQLLGNLFRYVAFANSARFFSEMKIKYAGTERDGQTATVPLTVIHAEEGEVAIDFVLQQNSARWQVVDVILDGVSMRRNLRTQFYKVIKKNDYAELLRRMNKKLKKAME